MTENGGLNPELWDVEIELSQFDEDEGWGMMGDIDLSRARGSYVGLVFGLLFVGLAAPGLWYIMRDHIDGLEYLRSGIELATRGFHTNLNMALFPRSYQPSGHLNISRSRETYIQWTSQYMSASTPCDLIAVAVAINFLLITDGSAVLRYST